MQLTPLLLLSLTPPIHPPAAHLLLAAPTPVPTHHPPPPTLTRTAPPCSPAHAQTTLTHTHLPLPSQHTCASLTPSQILQAIEIRRKSDAFNERVEDFRKFYLRSAPFAVGNFIAGVGGSEAKPEIKLEYVKPAYAILDQFHHGNVK